MHKNAILLIQNIDQIMINYPTKYIELESIVI